MQWPETGARKTRTESFLTSEQDGHKPQRAPFQKSATPQMVPAVLSFLSWLSSRIPLHNSQGVDFLLSHGFATLVVSS